MSPAVSATPLASKNNLALSQNGGRPEFSQLFNGEIHVTTKLHRILGVPKFLRQIQKFGSLRARHYADSRGKGGVPKVWG